MLTYTTEQTVIYVYLHRGR